ncbi:MAG: ABC transporter permease [bacterium]
METLRALLVDVLAQARSTWTLLLRTLHYVFHAPWDRPAIRQQMFSVGNRSIVFVLLTLGFLGAITSLQAGFQARRIIGDTSLIGQQLLPLLVRQLGPTLAGLMVATRVGTGIAAEIGSMVVTEQVDALRALAIDPIDYLIKPRLLACLIMLPVLVIFGVPAAFPRRHGWPTSCSTPHPWLRSWTSCTSSTWGRAAWRRRLRSASPSPSSRGPPASTPTGQREGVGEATTRAVVSCSLAVIVLDFLIGGLAFLVRTIEFRHRQQAFGSQVVLADVSLTVHPGQIVFIIGRVLPARACWSRPARPSSRRTRARFSLKVKRLRAS